MSSTVPARGERETIECDNCGITMWNTDHCHEEMAVHESECDWPDDRDARFEEGDRVQYSDFGRKRLGRDHREGEVIGFARKNDHCVRVRWDGRKTLENYAHSFIKHVGESE